MYKKVIITDFRSTDNSHYQVPSALWSFSSSLNQIWIYSNNLLFFSYSVFIRFLSIYRLWYWSSSVPFYPALHIRTQRSPYILTSGHNGSGALTSRCRRPALPQAPKWKDTMKDGGRQEELRDSYADVLTLRNCQDLLHTPGGSSM